VPPAVEDGDFGPQRTASACLPEPRAWVARLAQALAEVTAGLRPAGQLRRWTTDEVYAQVRGRAHRARAAGGLSQSPARAASRVVVRSVRVCEPTDGVVEACAVVDDSRRARALALRLEGTDGRWRCTSLVHL
jgi:hypothetical protein